MSRQDTGVGRTCPRKPSVISCRKHSAQAQPGIVSSAGSHWGPAQPPRDAEQCAWTTAAWSGTKQPLLQPPLPRTTAPHLQKSHPPWATSDVFWSFYIKKKMQFAAQAARGWGGHSSASSAQLPHQRCPRKLPSPAMHGQDLAPTGIFRSSSERGVPNKR